MPYSNLHLFPQVTSRLVKNLVDNAKATYHTLDDGSLDDSRPKSYEFIYLLPMLDTRDLNRGASYMVCAEAWRLAYGISGGRFSKLKRLATAELENTVDMRSITLRSLRYVVMVFFILHKYNFVPY